MSSFIFSTAAAGALSLKTTSMFCIDASHSPLTSRSKSSKGVLALLSTRPRSAPSAMARARKRHHQMRGVAEQRRAPARSGVPPVAGLQHPQRTHDEALGTRRIDERTQLYVPYPSKCCSTAARVSPSSAAASNVPRGDAHHVAAVALRDDGAAVAECEERPAPHE
jgi:hypothetical protein